MEETSAVTPVSTAVRSRAPRFDIHPNSGRVTNLPTNPFKRLNHILALLKRASTAGEKREKVSTTIKTLILRPVASWS